MQDEFPRGVEGLPGHACVAPITYTGHDAIRRNIADLKAALARPASRKGSSPRLRRRAPATTRFNEFYNDERDYVFAIAEALREEYLEIVNAGLVLQVDDAVLANMYDELVSQGGPSTIAAGRSCASRPSTTRCAASPRTASATTSASAAGTCRTWPTRRSTPSST